MDVGIDRWMNGQTVGWMDGVFGRVGSWKLNGSINGLGPGEMSPWKRARCTPMKTQVLHYHCLCEKQVVAVWGYSVHGAVRGIAGYQPHSRTSKRRVR